MSTITAKTVGIGGVILTVMNAGGERYTARLEGHDEVTVPKASDFIDAARKAWPKIQKQRESAKSVK